ncbi:CDGSH iron-sulfur domain-containing protein [Rhodococcus sp. NPDC058521]|uniref:CDGSH iron-sulfur domain-containing protein n=1 Tax=Rhodococcus sp. NPDC058521 TaxID=3346536 RepID=UPI003649027D
MTDNSDARSDIPEWNAPEVECVRRVLGGPTLVRGPVSITMPDGHVVSSDRFVVAVCRCRRSKIFPLCDTSHRKRRRPPGSTVERNEVS